MNISSQYIQNIAHSRGFTLCASARCRRLCEHEVFFSKWLASAYNASLSYLERNLDKRFNPATIVDNAKSVIVCAINYKNNASNYNFGNNIPKIASYALLEDYHDTIRAMLRSVLEDIKKRYPHINGRCFVDTAPLLEKAWAVEAGLGWIGKNSLLINPKYGSYLLLGEIVIDAEIDTYGTPMTDPAVGGCAGCNRCIDSCTTGAICSARIIDTRKCISMLTQYEPQTTPDRLDGWIFGCDQCQRCCPYNLKSPISNLKPIAEIQTLTRNYWLALKEEEFAVTFSKSPIARIKLDVIKQRIAEISIATTHKSEL